MDVASSTTATARASAATQERKRKEKQGAVAAMCSEMGLINNSFFTLFLETRQVRQTAQIVRCDRLWLLSEEWVDQHLVDCQSLCGVPLK
jgi:hypothetical protein